MTPPPHGHDQATTCSSPAAQYQFSYPLLVSVLSASSSPICKSFSEASPSQRHVVNASHEVSVAVESVLELITDEFKTHRWWLNAWINHPGNMHTDEIMQGNAIIPVPAIVTPEDYGHNNARLQHMRDVLASWEIMNEEGRRNYFATEQAKEELRRRAEEGEAAKHELERLDAEERNRRRFFIPAVSAVGRMLPAPQHMPPSNQAQSNPAQRHYRPQSYTQQYPATATIVE
ncbi:hypothetical protein PLICRDRAFT_180296, partial [Plicaturopsis crispa FD-325 SS-3]